MPIINIYTDGACSGNPGPGGYGYCVRNADGNLLYHGNMGFRRTTNSRMELYAVIRALTRTETHLAGQTTRSTDIKVHVWSDSQMVVKTINNGWRRKANKDLWEQLDNALAAFPAGAVEFHWVKGHAGNPGNNEADRLAVQARLNATEIDNVYEAIAGEPDNEGPVPPEQLFSQFVAKHPYADSLEISLYMYEQGFQYGLQQGENQ